MLYALRVAQLLVKQKKGMNIVQRFSNSEGTQPWAYYQSFDE
jgi:hypothetical protein